MSTRIADEAGHLWPRTGYRCGTCRMPTSLDAVHPGCAPLPSTQPEVNTAIELISHVLGARRSTSPSGLWQISGNRVEDLRTIPPRDPTRCTDCDETLSQRAIAGAVIRHLGCWSNPPENR